MKSKHNKTLTDPSLKLKKEASLILIEWVFEFKKRKFKLIKKD